MLDCCGGEGVRSKDHRVTVAVRMQLRLLDLFLTLVIVHRGAMRDGI